MRFPNAASGVKKLFTAQILGLIASVATIIGLIFLIFTAAAADANAQGGAVAAGLGTIILMGASAVLILIGSIMTLVGIIQASRDEGAFKTALIAIIVSLVAAVIAGIFSSNGLVQSICQIIQNVMNLAVTLFVINGVTNLAEKMNNTEVWSKGRNLLKVIVCIYALSLIASFISLIFGGIFMSVTAAILALIAAVLDVISYFLYLSLLNKGKKMLAE